VLGTRESYLASLKARDTNAAVAPR
jgi:hypothetical protein